MIPLVCLIIYLFFSSYLVPTQNTVQPQGLTEQKAFYELYRSTEQKIETGIISSESSTFPELSELPEISIQLSEEFDITLSEIQTENEKVNQGINSVHEKLENKTDDWNLPEEESLQIPEIMNFTNIVN